MWLDSVAIVGEVMSWIGLGVGLPMMVFVRVLRATKRAWRTVDILVIRQEEQLTARWFANGSIHERPLRAREAYRIREGWHDGQVSLRDPNRMQLASWSTLGPTLSTLGWTFVGAGAIGLAVSWLPLFT